MRLLYRPINFFCRYKYPYNINREQNKSYLKKIQKAQEQIDKAEQINKIPRRKRRVYDRPRINRDIDGYGAWRVYDYDQWIYKPHPHAMQVLLRMQLSPKWLVHAFGQGCITKSNQNSAHRQFMFMDNQWNGFLLYQYRNTTAYKPNKQNYNYDEQQHLHPRARLSKRVSPEQFWSSQDLFQFRINGTQYAEKFKFEEWIKKTIEKRKTMKSYDEYIEEKFGKTQTFNTIEQSQLFEAHKPMILSITPEHYTPKKGKTPTPPAKLTWSKLSEQYRIQSLNSQENNKAATN